MQIRASQIKIKNIYILVIFLAVISVPLGTLFFPNIKLPYEQISPSPLVFSIGKKLFIRETANQFILVSSSGKTERFKFDKDYFNNLKGSHRIKVRAHTILKRVNYKYFQEKKALSYLLCSSYLAKKYFGEADDITAIQVLDNNNQEVLNLSCNL